MSSPNKYYYIIGFAGILLTTTGLFLGNKINIGKNSVEAFQTPDPDTSTGQKINTDNIVIDISGAVENPGVYHLSSGSRIEDALVASGGLASSADRNWVDKNLNRAAKVIDGQKIYIPQIQQSNAPGANSSSTVSNVAQSYNTSDSNLININSASSSQLDGLPGIGQVYAQKIIDQRPYSDTNELVSRKVVTQSIFEKIKNLITVF